jgi:chemotaxis protein methyltransferase CheR
MAFTFFFRDLQTLENIVHHVTDQGAGRSRFAIWDAGCAMGQEPYSLAILLAEKMGRFAFKNLRIDATDIDNSNLFESIITSGVYTEQELQRIPRGLFEKYFRPAENEGQCVVDYSIRSRIAFRRHDLLNLEPAGRDYTLILCKNVLLHFTAEQRADVIRMFHAALAPGGYFATEQTQKLPVEVAHFFTPVSNEVQLFRKVEAA